MGSKYQDKDVSIWIPHLHVLPVFNELAFPQARRTAIDFNRRLIQDKFFDALIVYNVYSDAISEGMRGEIETFRTLGLPVISYNNFIKNAKRLPSPDRALEYFNSLVTLYESNKHRFFIP